MRKRKSEENLAIVSAIAGVFFGLTEHDFPLQPKIEYVRIMISKEQIKDSYSIISDSSIRIYQTSLCENSLLTTE